MLKDASMFDCNSTLTPMEIYVKYYKGYVKEDGDATEYRSLVGRLIYLLQTRQNLSYAVGITSWYMKEPKNRIC